MPAICLYFRAHQSVALKKISFFEFGQDPDLIDHPQNYKNLHKRLNQLYIPAFSTLRAMISNHRGAFHLSFSMSGILLEQIHKYFPHHYTQLVEFMQLKEIEVIASTFYHSCASACSLNEFRMQLILQLKKISEITPKRSNYFCNADLSYHSAMGETIYGLGLKGVFFRPWEKKNAADDSIYSIYHDPGFKNLKLIPADEKFQEAVRKGPFQKSSEAKALSVSMVSDIIEHPASLMVFPIDLDDPAIPVTGIKSRLNFIKQFVELSLATEKITFRNPSQFLEGNINTKKLFIRNPVHQKIDPSGYDSVLRKEALRYLYSLEQKIKTTNDRHLLHLWRILQSHDHLKKLSRERSQEKKRTTIQLEAPSPHEAYLDFMNALSALDIYAQKKIEQVS
jgi:alpha-amylase